MSPIDLADAAKELDDLASAAGDEAEREALRELGQAITVGNIANSTGIAIGQDIRQVINRFELSPDTAAALLDLRTMLGNRLGIEASRYEWGELLADRTRDFVGRGHVFQAIDEFQASNPSGYFV